MADNFDNDDIYTLTDEDGNERQVEILDTAEVDGVRYYALTPVEEEESDEEETALIVMRASCDENGENYLDSIEDDEEYERIGNMFIDRLNSYLDDEED